MPDELLRELREEYERQKRARTLSPTWTRPTADALREQLNKHLERVRRIPGRIDPPTAFACSTCEDTRREYLLNEQGRITAVRQCSACAGTKGAPSGRMRVVDIPVKFAHARLADYPRASYSNAAIKAAYELLDGNRDGLYVYGPPGAGKTLLQCATANDVCSRLQVRGAFIRMDVFYAVSQRAISDSTKKPEAEALEDRAMAAPLVILDDFPGFDEVGPAVSDFKHGFLLRILARRLDRRLKTLISSNLTPDEVSAAVLDTRIESRIAELCGASIPMIGPDHRLEMAATVDRRSRAAGEGR